MYFHVSSKISCFWTCIIALCALVWCLFTVGEYIWLFRFPARPNEPPHFAHLCTFCPVWVIMCILNEPASLNAFIHSEQVWAFTPLWVSNEHVRFQMCSLTKWLVAFDTNLWSFFPWVSMCGYWDVLLDQLRWNVKNISLIYSARAWWWWWPVLSEYKSLRGLTDFWHFSDRVWEAWKAGGW